MKMKEISPEGDTPMGTFRTAQVQNNNREKSNILIPKLAIVVLGVRYITSYALGTRVLNWQIDAFVSYIVLVIPNGI